MSVLSLVGPAYLFFCDIYYLYLYAQTTLAFYDHFTYSLRLGMTFDDIS